MVNRFLAFVLLQVLLLVTSFEVLAAGPHHGESVDARHHDGASAGGHEDLAAAAHESAGLPQLDPEWFASQIFWLVMTFGLLYVVFGKKILPEISGVIDKRRSQIRDDLDSAKKLKEESEEVQSAYEDALSEARRKSSDLFVAVESDMRAKADDAAAAFRGRSMKEVAKTEGYIQKATEEAMDEMNTIAAEIASQAAEKIVGIPMDVARAKDVVQNMNKKAA